MKFTISWLKKFLNTEASIEQIIDKLTHLGLEVEEVVNQEELYKPFIVAEIISATQHPEADKLRVCKVSDGTKEFQIVCGAPNARAGIKVVLAPIGSVIPSNGMKIKESKIRNVSSSGMLCSGKELGISEESDGIIELESECKVGESFAKIYGLNEIFIEISVTPNRGDCLGVYGIARDLAASGIGALKNIEFHEEIGNFDSPIKVKIDNTDICSKYIGRYFKNIKNCISPEWLQKDLKAIGVNPISALVDITNYFTFAFGRPLHVYDAESVDSISVRKAVNGEIITALNDKEYVLNHEEGVIADGDKLLAIAGIIGGKDSSVSLESKNIFLEIGYFPPDSIVKTSRLHKLDTDAKFRFERKVDPEFMDIALNLVTKMITDICGGEFSKKITLDNLNYNSHQIIFPLSELVKKIGHEYSDNKIENILLSLGFSINKKEDKVWLLSVPSWRPYIISKEDVVEEISRIDGYDNIPDIEIPHVRTSNSTLDLSQKNIYRIHRFPASLGLDEVVTWSFMNSNKAAFFSELKEELYVKNPISVELNYMRPSILPNLLDVVVRNKNRGINNIGLFELANIFNGIKPQQQILSLAGIRSGFNNERNIYKDYREVDVFDSKSDILNILGELGVNDSNLQYSTENLPKYYHPGRSSSLALGKNVLGYFGEIHPSVRKEYEIESNIVAFEIFLDNVPILKPKFGRKPSLCVSDYQEVERDFAFIVKKDISIQTIVKSVLQVDKKLFKNINIFDVYSGKGINDDEKSVAFTVTFQAIDRTLSDVEIDNLCKQVIDSVTKSTNGILRSV